MGATFPSAWVRNRDASSERLRFAERPKAEILGLTTGPFAKEFRALSHEPDPEMFFEGLFQLGQRLEADDRIEAAGAVYSAIVQARTPLPGPPPQGGRGLVGEGPSSFFPSPLGGEGPRRGGEGENAALNHIQNRAQQRLAVLNGGGPSGLHSEYLLRRLSKETLEPTTLFGFGLASAGLRTVRLATLSRLAATPTANALTRGFGAQATAGIFGMTAEAALFPFAVRGAALALGRDLDWSYPQLGKELGSSFLLLGAMRLTNLGASAIYRRVNGNSVGARFTLPAGRQVAPAGAINGAPTGMLRQTTMFAGIAMGLHLETVAGLRHPTDGSTLLLDSLATWAQVNVAGRVVRGVLGEGFASWERAMDIYTERVATSPHLTVSLRGPQDRSNPPLAASRALRARDLIAEGSLRRSAPRDRFAPRKDTLIPPPLVLQKNPHILMMENKNDRSSDSRIQIKGSRPGRNTTGVLEQPRNFRESFHRLLENAPNQDQPQLEGALAEFIRYDSELREELRDRLAAEQDPAFVELNGRKGYLTKIFFLRGDSQLRPQKILFAHKILRYDDNLDLMVYGLEWLPGNEIRANLFFPRTGQAPKSESHHSGQAISPQIVGPQRLRWDLFPKTSYHLWVERTGDSNPQWEILQPQGYPIFSIPNRFP